MANKTTVALNMDQYKEIIETMKSGGVGFRPNNRIATALVLEANLGLRIEDILNLKLKDIISDGSRYRLNKKKKRPAKKGPLPFLCRSTTISKSMPLIMA